MKAIISLENGVGARQVPRVFGVALEYISLFYIFAPIFLFLFGWLKFSVMFPVILVLSIALLIEIARISRSKDKPYPCDPTGPRAAVLLRLCVIMVIVGILVFLSGWGVKPKTGDFQKHMSFLRDFVQYTWPFGYMDTGSNHIPGIMNAYIGF